MSLPAESVLAASNAWAWVPDNAVTVETDEYLLVRFPDYFDHLLELTRFSPAGRVEDAVAMVLDRAREFGLPDLYWFARLDGPAAVPEILAARGATVAETLDVLALDLRPDGPDEAGWAGAPTRATRGVELRWQTDIAIARDAAVLGAEVFGGSVPPDERLAENAARDRAAVVSGEGGTVVAYAGGMAVGVGGVTMVGDVARLWGGAVAEHARGRGVYRALLRARLTYAAAHGGTMALVKGRIETSGPILRRAGFVVFGQEKIFRVPLGLPAAGDVRPPVRVRADHRRARRAHPGQAVLRVKGAGRRVCRRRADTGRSARREPPGGVAVIV